MIEPSITWCSLPVLVLLHLHCVNMGLIFTLIKFKTKLWLTFKSTYFPLLDYHNKKKQYIINKDIFVTAETTAASNEALDSPLSSSKVMRRKRVDRTSSSNGLLNSTVADYALHNNNNNVKNERLVGFLLQKQKFLNVHLSDWCRLSPNTPDTSSRSRSATPSGTAHPEVSSADNPLLAPITGRNYSDFMRSLAAKYNHANPNE